MSRRLGGPWPLPETYGCALGPVAFLGDGVTAACSVESCWTPQYWWGQKSSITIHNISFSATLSISKLFMVNSLSFGQIFWLRQDNLGEIWFDGRAKWSVFLKRWGTAAINAERFSELSPVEGRGDRGNWIHVAIAMPSTTHLGMVYTTHKKWWLGGWFIIAIPTLNDESRIAGCCFTRKMRCNISPHLKMIQSGTKGIAGTNIQHGYTRWFD